MKKIVNTFIAAAVLSASAALSAFGQQASAVTPVPSVDLDRYTGKWYEIAKYPNKFQKDCQSNTTATYSKKSNGKIEVKNECTEQDGKTKTAVGEAKIVDKASNAKLKVRFAPGWLSFIPSVWGNYWVIDLAPDYRYSVVGEPDREFLWILSRTPQISDSDYENIRKKLESIGYDPARLVTTPQSASAGPAAQ